MRLPPPPSRPRTAAAIAAGLLLLIGFASVVRVPDGEWAVRRGPGGERRLDPGLHFRLPLLQSIARYPGGPVELRGEARYVTVEGASGEIGYEAALRLEPERLVELDRARGDEDWLGFLRGRIEAGLGEQLPRAGLIDRMSVLGVAVERLEIGGSPPAGGPGGGGAPDWAAAARPAEWKLVVIGLDGADWSILAPMIERGEAPVLARLRREGAWATLRAEPPLLSPLIWTTVATGRGPDEHGIVDFLVRDPERGLKVPITSDYRRVKALWNLFSDAGRRVDVVAWWATWPAEPIRGRMVTDRVAYSLFGYQATGADRAGSTWPEDYFAAIEPLVRGPDAVRHAEIERFVSIGAAEYEAARREAAADPKKGYRNPINHLARILASTETYAAVARQMLRDGPADLSLFYFQGIDEVCHRFAHYMPPKMKMVEEEKFRKFRGAVEAFYRYQDAVLGRVLEAAGPRTVVMILSDHGFWTGGNRPTDAPADIEGKPAKWHRPYGIWILHGPPVVPGRIDTVAVADVAPTLLHLAGLPLSDELDGEPILAALRPEYRSAPAGRVATYERGGDRPAAVARAPLRIDAEMIEKLRSLGYIGPSDEEIPQAPVSPGGGRRRTTVTYHSNLAAVHLRKNEYGRAERELRRALEIYPRYTPARQMLVQVLMHGERWDEALAEAGRVVGSGREFEPGLFLQMAKIHEARGSVDEGIGELRRLEDRFPGFAELPTAIGVLELARDRPAGAEAEFRAALAIDPAATQPMAHLFPLYRERGRALELRPEIETALRVNPQSVMHRNWMGLLLQAEGDFRAAEEEFLAAREIDPEFPGTAANLGALYGRLGRLAEAEVILRKAAEKFPKNVEARVNLGAVLGKQGRPAEAAASLEQAVGLGHRTPGVYNAIGRAWFEAGDLPRAIAALRESLLIDPEQPEIRRILGELEAGPTPAPAPPSR